MPLGRGRGVGLLHCHAGGALREEKWTPPATFNLTSSMPPPKTHVVVKREKRQRLGAEGRAWSLCDAGRRPQ